MREVNPAVSTLTQPAILAGFQYPICATYDFLYSPYPPSYPLHPFTRPDLDTLERPIRMTLAFLDLSPLYLSYHSHNFACLLNPLLEVVCNEKYLIEHPETCSFERLLGFGSGSDGKGEGCKSCRVLPQCGPGDHSHVPLIPHSVGRRYSITLTTVFPSPWALSGYSNYSTFFLSPLFDFHRADQEIILVSIHYSHSYSTPEFRRTSWITHSVASFPPSMSIRLTTKP